MIRSYTPCCSSEYIRSVRISYQCKSQRKYSNESRNDTKACPKVVYEVKNYDTEDWEHRCNEGGDMANEFVELHIWDVDVRVIRTSFGVDGFVFLFLCESEVSIHAQSSVGFYSIGIGN
jgi:hypothetical protein